MLSSNEYFNGQVKSIGFQTKTLPATVGVMAPGEYQFDTNQKETMTVVFGQLTVQLPNSNEWVSYHQNDSFIVDANCTFQLKVDVDTAYLCTYEQ